MSNTKSLPAAVEALQNKAKEHKQAENTQFHVSIAQHNIREVNNELDELADSLADLRYCKTVLKGAFDESAPTMTSSAVQAAEKATELTQDELLADVQSGEMESDDSDLVSDDDDDQPEIHLTPEVQQQIKQIQSAKRQVDSVYKKIKRQLKSHCDEWDTKIGAAEELQKILGGQNQDFSRTLNHMHRLLEHKLFDQNGTGSQFVSEWENAVENWEKHQSLQSFDDFQAEHDLSDSTVEDVRTLSKSNQLTLADVSLTSLEEMKGVEDLESAVELSL